MGQVSRIAFCLFFTGSIFAVERPSWINSPPKASAKLNYFVGLSTAAESEESAIRLARANATERGILELFGGEFSIENKIEQTTKSVDANFKVVESIKNVNLKNVSTLNSFVEKSGIGFNGYVLISIPASEVKRELARLEESRIQENESKVSYPDKAGEAPTLKLRKNMKKSEVIKMFGAPASDSDEGSFKYKSAEYCLLKYQSYWCNVHFSNGKVTGWLNFKSELTSDWEDEPVQVSVSKKPKAMKKIIDNYKTTYQGNYSWLAGKYGHDSFIYFCSMRLEHDPNQRHKNFTSLDIGNICQCEVHIAMKYYNYEQYFRNRSLAFENHLIELNKCKASKE